MMKFSMELKIMPWSYKGHEFILVVIDEVTNFMVTIIIYEARLEEIGDTLNEHVFSKNNTPECMIMNQDSAFMSTLIT